MTRTAFTAGEITLLYTQPHALIGLGLAIHKPATVWSGTITAVPTFPSDGTGVGQLAVTTVTGAYTAVVEGMTVIIGDTTSSTYAYYTYARKASTGATVLFIDGQGNGAATIAIGTAFTVLNHYMPWPRRFRYNSGSWYCNFDETYTDQNENIRPQAVMGCSAVIYGNGSKTFNFDGTRSKAWATGATITAYLWTFPDATTSASSAPTWSTSTAYPDGAYVHLRVTDSNGNTHTGHRLIFKFDSSNPPKTDFEVTSPRHVEWGSGATVEIKSLDRYFNVNSTYTPIMDHCVLFYRTAYATTIQEIGGNHPNRENIIFDGWVVGSSVEQSKDGDLYTYSLATNDELLRRQQGFAVEIDNNAGSPTDWLTMKPMTLDNVGWHYCLHRSTIGLMTDVFFPNTTASTRTKHLHDISAGTMWEQLKSHYGWLIGGTVSCDEQGAIYCEQDVLINTSATSVFVMGLADTSAHGSQTVLRAGYSTASHPLYIRAVAKQTAYGIDYSSPTDIPVGSRAPDDPLAHGENNEEIPAGLWGTQTEINRWAANLRAKKDNPNPSSHFPLVGIINITPTPQCRVIAYRNDLTAYVRSADMEFDTEHGMCYTTIDCENAPNSVPTGTTIVFT